MEEKTQKPQETTELARAIAIMARLRGPGGCPWDREQTFETIRRHTLEETYEVFDAIERRHWADLRDELGDLLLQVLFYAQMAAEAGYFGIEDVAASLNAKLIRRHPHIFGETKAETADAVKTNWDAIKRQEKAERGEAEAEGWLDGVPRHMPALLEAEKLGARAAKVGFDWPDTQELLDKVDEETRELREAVSAGEAGREEELGDLLFTCVNLARHLKLEPEFTLREANAKFRARFTAMEAMAGGETALREATPEALEALWARAKVALRGDGARAARAEA